MQVPEPLQSEPVTVPFEQVVAAQGVLAEAGWQPPPPLQKPLVTQLLADGVQSLPGSVPAATLPHTPSAPPPFSAALHAWHGPLQAVLQQTPSAQFSPLPQMWPTEQQKNGSPACMHVVPQQSSPGQHASPLPPHLKPPVQIACVTRPSRSPSDVSPGAPDAHAYSSCASNSAHKIAKFENRLRELCNRPILRIDTRRACGFRQSLPPCLIVMQLSRTPDHANDAGSI